jgi:hypothetical protein
MLFRLLAGQIESLGVFGGAPFTSLLPSYLTARSRFISSTSSNILARSFSFAACSHSSCQRSWVLPCIEVHRLALNSSPILSSMSAPKSTLSQDKSNCKVGTGLLVPPVIALVSIRTRLLCLAIHSPTELVSGSHAHKPPVFSQSAASQESCHSSRRGVNPHFRNEVVPASLRCYLSSVFMRV